MDELIYRFGRHGEYTLNERALRHIVHGDFVVRPTIDSAGEKITEDVLAGGLHTLAGWTAFISKYPHIVNLIEYDPSLDSAWYFGRELQNGVITLKIPRKLFSKDAATITMGPDLHYKSGYLWKTLFPKEYTEKDILDVVAEALLHIDNEESDINEKQSLIIGFARTMDPFKAIRIRIQLEGSEIRSVFPTWDQPHTGNNGKPYSHEQSISFHLAESTLGMGERKYLKSRSRLFSTGGFNLYALIDLTPQFLLKRSPPEYGKIQDLWNAERLEKISLYVDSSHAEDLLKIQTYLNEFCISKEPFFIQAQLYQFELDLMEKYPGLINVAAVVQNVYECFYALQCFDNRNKTRCFLDALQRFLAMGVIHAGGLNVLEFKRLFALLLKCTKAHHANDAFKIFMESLATSPIRSALYTEFNLNPYVKTNDDAGLGAIGTTGLELPIQEKIFIDFVAFSLGENYLLYFSEEERKKISQILIAQNYSARLVRDSLSYFSGGDFDFFGFELIALDELDASKIKPNEDAMSTIMREYCRMLVAYRQRIVMEDPAAYEADPFDYPFGSQEHFDILKQKHKRSFVMFVHRILLEKMIKFSAHVGYLKLGKKASYLLSVMTKERVPLPKRIPTYIPSWMQKSEYQGNKKNDFSFLGDPTGSR